MTVGRASRIGMDPAVVLEFIDAWTTHTVGGVPKRRRKLFNGFPIGQGDHARIIRRWRAGEFEALTEPAVARMLNHYDLTLSDLTYWAQHAQREPYIRNYKEITL